MSVVEYRQVRMAYGEKVIIDKFNLSIEKGEFVTIIGSSGCGKTTILKMVNGLVQPVGGEVLVEGRNTREVDLTMLRRNIGYAIQGSVLFPHMTVEKNIAYVPNLLNRKDKKRTAQAVAKWMGIVGLDDSLRSRYPSELSGGQQQRTALARIMAYEPDIILLDEPFSALDMYLKDQLQRELAEMLEDYEGTVILVSHNRDEVYRFSEELLVIDQGKIAVRGKTKDIFENPVSLEAARLTGCKNFSRARRLDAHTAEALDWGVALRTSREIPEDTLWVGYRAHDFVPVWGEGGDNLLKFDLESSAELPFEHNYYIKAGETVCWFVQREKMSEIEEKGLPDYLRLAEDKILFLK